jgi:hypothetical protein
MFSCILDVQLQQYDNQDIEDIILCLNNLVTRSTDPDEVFSASLWEYIIADVDNSNYDGDYMQL